MQEDEGNIFELIEEESYYENLWLERKEEENAKNRW